MINVGIIGLGFVGAALKQKFQLKFNVFAYDIIKEKSNSTLQELVKKSSLIFICLPTPTKSNGQTNLSSIFSVYSQLGSFGYKNICILKSTVLPGTTVQLNNLYPSIKTIHNPEFLREKSSFEDFNNLRKIILGGKKEITKSVASFYSQIFPESKIYFTKSTTSEMVKYYINTFLAMKVSFANEMFQFCNKLDIDYDELLKLVYTDERIGKSHLNVPGHDGSFGFGGMCFPKDLDALIHFVNELKLDNTVLQAIKYKNKSVRK